MSNFFTLSAVAAFVLLCASTAGAALSQSTALSSENGTFGGFVNSTSNETFADAISNQTFAQSPNSTSINQTFTDAINSNQTFAEAINSTGNVTDGDIIGAGRRK